jgi:hypothetical protein
MKRSRKPGLDTSPAIRIIRVFMWQSPYCVEMIRKYNQG